MNKPLTTLLRTKGLRRSRLRLHLLPLLQKSAVPLDVPGILVGLKKRGLGVNKTSVYRELARLSDDRIVRSTDFGDGRQRFELMPTTHHHHLVCTSCRTAKDVPLEKDLDGIERSIMKKYGFSIRDHRLEFFGLCPNCQ